MLAGRRRKRRGLAMGSRPDRADRRLPPRKSLRRGLKSGLAPRGACPLLRPAVFRTIGMGIESIVAAGEQTRARPVVRMNASRYLFRPDAVYNFDVGMDVLPQETAPH